MITDRKLDAFMKHRSDKEYRTMWIHNGYSQTELRKCIYRFLKSNDGYLKSDEELECFVDFQINIHTSMLKTFTNANDSNYLVASVLIYLVVKELRKIKWFSIPRKILPNDNFTEILENFCNVYRINVDRNQICFIYENELNQNTAKKIKYQDFYKYND